ncbi:rod shape-determining protein MreC [Clostridium collagenovorans DSM 3089]|uniref:Cell shape-determining protein MreC n=1 Tax=Clostridium collagenovorans DSM 3089 TaxID=1121306 RepID=A0A1M5XT06_9CLOT|nr:rod shape-determining protein MreC [Clostridium collagenovorans]SHI02648.1 rod shape-determining protein MreC [Clostridium collagenovorans DSM 3089]
MKFLKKNKLAILIVVLSIGFLVLIGTSTKSPNTNLAENGIGAVLNPIHRVLYKVGTKVRSSFSFITNFKEVKNENNELKDQNRELKNKALGYDILKKENDRLRSMLNYVESSSNDYSYIGADIIGISGNSFLDGFIINHGSDNGIEKGMVAMTGEGLVGQVTSVGSNWAIVQSLSNENIAVAGYVERVSENNGIVKGYRDDNNRLLAQIEIPSLESEIQKGDIILTSGIGGIYPKGLKIGEVIEVTENKADISKTGIIKPYVDINKLEEIFIVIPKEKREVKY